jgi:hypothetical protein
MNLSAEAAFELRVLSRVDDEYAIVKAGASCQLLKSHCPNSGTPARTRSRVKFLTGFRGSAFQHPTQESKLAES